MLLDHVHSGKALAVLLADARAGAAGPHAPRHSGGLPGVMPADVQRRLAAFANAADGRRRA